MARHHHHHHDHDGKREGCGPRGFRIDLPDALMAMGNGRGFRGSFGPFSFDFGDFDSGSSRRGRGGGRRSKRMFESGELRLVLLKLIADQPRHGYELIKAIEDMTGGEYAPSPGVVYPTLTMLEDMSLIAEKKSKDSKKIFECTDDGRSHLAENEAEVEELMERLADLAPKESHEPGPAIGRAVRNLMTALGHRIGREGLDEELLLEIAAILDEAAQRIERVK